MKQIIYLSCMQCSGFADTTSSERASKGQIIVALFLILEQMHSNYMIVSVSLQLSSLINTTTTRLVPSLFFLSGALFLPNHVKLHWTNWGCSNKPAGGAQGTSQQQKWAKPKAASSVVPLSHCSWRLPLGTVLRGEDRPLTMNWHHQCRSHFHHDAHAAASYCGTNLMDGSSHGYY